MVRIVVLNIAATRIYFKFHFILTVEDGMSGSGTWLSINILLDGRHPPPLSAGRGHVLWKVFRIGTVRYNWPMSAHASQAFITAR